MPVIACLSAEQVERVRAMLAAQDAADEAVEEALAVLGPPGGSLPGSRSEYGLPNARSSPPSPEMHPRRKAADSTTARSARRRGGRVAPGAVEAARSKRLGADQARRDRGGTHRPGQELTRARRRIEHPFAPAIGHGARAAWEPPSVAAYVSVRWRPPAIALRSRSTRSAFAGVSPSPMSS